MADRTYNTVDICIYDEDWDESTLLVALMLLTKCPNQYGIFKMPTGFLKKTFSKHFTPEDIEKGVKNLVDDGMINLYKDSTVVWIKKKWSRDGYYNVSNNQLGALRFIKEEFPCVYADFEQEYGLVLTEVQKKVDRGTKKKQQKPLPSGDSRQHPESDTDSESEKIELLKKKEAAKAADVAEKTNSKPTSDQQIITDTYQELYVPLFGGEKPKWTSKDFRHCQTILKSFSAYEVVSCIRFMFANHDDLWSNNLGVFMSLTSTKLLQRAISKQRNPQAGKSSTENTYYVKGT